MRTLLIVCLTGLATGAAMALARAIGFVDGSVFGVAWHSGIALAMTVRFRAWGAIGCGLGALCAELAMDQPAVAAATVAAAVFIASLSARRLMRDMARRYEMRTKTNTWLNFFAGSALYSAVSVGVVSGVEAALGGAAAALSFAPLRAMAELLGVCCIASVFASLGEVRRLRGLDWLTLGGAVLTALLVLSVFLLLTYSRPFDGRSTIIVLLAIPASIWLSLLPHSLAGTIISFCGFQSALWLILKDAGSVLEPQYGMVSASYLVLVVSFQLVHALNLDRRTALAALAAQKDELEQRVLERTAGLSKMTMRAVAADKTKSEFLAKVSHELRTPLNGIIGLSSIMIADKVTDAQRETLGLIHSSGLDLLGMISRILDLSRPEIDDSVVFDPISPRRLIEDAIARRGGQLADKPELSITTELDPALPEMLFGDGTGVGELLDILTDNAVKFTETGVVALSATRVGEGRNPRAVNVRFMVDDTGVGVHPEDQERIFQPFEQAENGSRRAFGGAGLGLSIAADLAAGLGTEIRIESTPGAGATFWFEVDLDAAAPDLGQVEAA